MTIAMPRLIQHVSPNQTDVDIAHDLFFLHDQEGHTLPSVAWLCNPAAKASATWCLGEDMSDPVVYQLVPCSKKAWAQCAFNSKGCSLEIPGFQNQGFSDQLLRTAALIAVWYCRAYSIPLVWAKGGQGRGLVDHHGLGPAGGGHVDVGPEGGTAWSTFMRFTQEIDSQFGSDIPHWALNGAPGPHEVVGLPIDVKPAPSHGGAPRAEDSDTHAHPTPSGFAAHSIAALQADLNALMAPKTAPLLVDGWFGHQTQSELRAFQALHGLTADGLIGPDSWRAIDVALAA